MHNPDYAATFVFENDFAALLSGTTPQVFSRTLDNRDGPPLLIAEGERGICRVVCFSPRHDLTFAQMGASAIRRVIDTWADQYSELGGIPWVRYVQVFENRGAMMGASNPHPHGQIWANEHVPNEPAKEQKQQQAHVSAHGSCLLCDYLALEQSLGQRIVCQNEHFVALVPFWAVWPFETLLLPRAHHGALTDLGPEARDGLTNVL